MEVGKVVFAPNSEPVKPGEARSLAAPVRFIPDPEKQEKRARRLFDEMARNIGREAVNHLKTMYPECLTEYAGKSKSWETSMVNTIRNDINWRMRPLLMAMIAMHQEWEEEQTQTEQNPAHVTPGQDD